nr:adenylate/guanylate cyclase domain-containing protein [Kofleriaceae bacterium]
MTTELVLKRHVTVSIGTKLVAGIALLVGAIISVVVWQWAASERTRMYDEQRDDALALARSMSYLMINLVDDHNFSQMQVDLEQLARSDADIAYVIVHATSQDNRVVGSAPGEYGDRADYFPDVVPLQVTRDQAAATGVQYRDTYALRDVAMSAGEAPRIHRGDRVVEVAVPIVVTSHAAQIGVLRVGRSLDEVDRAVADAVHRALWIGALALVVALAGAWLVGRTLARPITRLSRDAERIASGDLGHRVASDTAARRDEIGALASSFDEMSQKLDASFGKLRDTAASFQRFVPEKFLAVVAPEGLEKIKIGTAAPRTIAVLFSDIRGFTKMSEHMTPAEVFELLNVYLARMGAAIDRAGGFVDKYIGDAIMALFDDAHTDALLHAVIGMRAALAELNRERAADGKPPVETGIGAHGGDVVMGTIGFASKIESTVIGDPVNVASRVESMTKDYHVSVLLTGDVVARVKDRAAFPLRLLAEKVAVRGRVDPIDLYTLDLDADSTTPSSDSAPPRDAT